MGTKHYCDRCGQQAKEWELVDISDLWNKIELAEKDKEILEVCKVCAKAIKKFILTNPTKKKMTK